MVISASVMFRELTAYMGWELRILLNILQPNNLWYLVPLKVLKRIQFSENCFCYIYTQSCMAYINNWVFCNKAQFVYLSGRLWKRKALLGKWNWERWDMGEGRGESLGGVQAGKDSLLFCQALNRGVLWVTALWERATQPCIFPLVFLLISWSLAAVTLPGY